MCTTGGCTRRALVAGFPVCTLCAPTALLPVGAGGAGNCLAGGATAACTGEAGGWAARAQLLPKRRAWISSSLPEEQAPSFTGVDMLNCMRWEAGSSSADQPALPAPVQAWAAGGRRWPPQLRLRSERAMSESCDSAELHYASQQQRH